MKTLGFTLYAGEKGARMTKMSYTDARRELNHFLGLDVAQAIDTGDTVTDRQDAASLLDVDRGGGVQDAVLQDRRHLSGGRLVCKRAHNIRERREKWRPLDPRPCQTHGELFGLGHVLALAKAGADVVSLRMAGTATLAATRVVI